MSYNPLVSVKDLFKWKIRTTVIDEDGNERVEWESPKRPANPFRLLGMLSMVGWGAYLIGFSAWMADAYDFHTLSIQSEYDFCCAWRSGS